jgi:UPF0755 protein
MNEEDYNTEIQVEDEIKQPPKKRRLFWWLFVCLILLIISSYYTYTYLKTPPADFPVNTPITIELGTSLREVVAIAKESGIVRSKWLLYAKLMYRHSDTPVMASTYIFEQPLALEALATRLTEGDHDSTLIKLTIPEGSSVKDIIAIASETLNDFDAATFLDLSAGQEGYLFPETYHIPATYTATELYTLLNDTFSEQVQTLEPGLSDHPLTLTEIVILASIIEREANTEESMKIVSGILQERLRLGIALQVDASMEYVLDKPLSELTADDLKQESAYNTYLNAGLPPTPISNPGLDSIKAVLNPTPTDYLFYITGTDGEFYYARDFEEHKQNITRYLR